MAKSVKRRVVTCAAEPAAALTPRLMLANTVGGGRPPLRRASSFPAAVPAEQRAGKTQGDYFKTNPYVKSYEEKLYYEVKLCLLHGSYPIMLQAGGKILL